MQTPIESRIKISLPQLRKEGYFEEQDSGVLFYANAYTGQLQLRIRLQLLINVDWPEQGGSMILRYEQAGQQVCQTVELVHQPSNLGLGGGIWYWLCPKTGKRCRMLVLSSSGFVSRHAEGGSRYDSQLCARRDRDFIRLVRLLEKEHQARRWIFTKGSKRVYANQPTRPMRRLTWLIQQVEQASSKTSY